MNLAQLTYFCHLAKTEHYTRSAESLHVSQSALSHSISSLEKMLGCRLFRKTGRNVQLTDDGRIFLKYVSGGLASIDRGIAELDRRSNGLSGSINVGAIATVRSGLSACSDAGLSLSIWRQNRISCAAGRNGAVEPKARTGRM